MLLRSIALLTGLILSTCVNAHDAVPISDAELKSIARENRILNFAGDGQELEITEQYSIATIYEPPKKEGGYLHFYKGRRYALVTLDRKAKHVLVVLELGELENNQEPFPISATSTSAEFSFVDQYTEYRRVRFTFASPADNAFSAVELSPAGTADFQ